MSRPIRARVTASIAIAPVIVSDLTSAQVVGLEPRQFREFLRRANVPYAVAGRRVLARIEHVVAAIDRLAAREPIAETDAETSDVEPNADEILARIGRRRTAACAAKGVV